MKCKKCGLDIDENSMFCKMCGAKVKELNYKWDELQIGKIKIQKYPYEAQNPIDTFQDYLKKTLKTLFDYGLIPRSELELLQQKDYCMKTFALSFPLLEKDPEKRIDKKGHARYYWYPIGGFYICNDWWKDKIPVHIEKFNEWLLRLSELYQLWREGKLHF